VCCGNRRQLVLNTGERGLGGGHTGERGLSLRLMDRQQSPAAVESMMGEGWPVFPVKMRVVCFDNGSCGCVQAREGGGAL
jgi:hypothetical protein